MSSSKESTVVEFHEVFDENYGPLSPLSAHPITVRHKVYSSLHHYFLCERFRDSPVETLVMNAASIWELDRLVADAERQGYEREDWLRMRMDVMLLGNYYKFAQNEGARSVLLGTGAKLLVNHTPTDEFWGDGGDGTGKNMLGVVLMAVRDRLAREKPLSESKDTGSSSKAAGMAGKGLRATRAVHAARAA